MWRRTTTALVAVFALSAVSLPADARSKRGKRVVVAPYPYERSVRSYERGDSHECIRARSLDPGGNYKAYPCWARAALSGNARR